MKFVDLFAGLGGFHLALSRLGHECVFASEIKPKLRKLYQINYQPDNSTTSISIYLSQVQSTMYSSLKQVMTLMQKKSQNS